MDFGASNQCADARSGTNQRRRRLQVLREAGEMPFYQTLSVFYPE